ncbi:cation:proton antiporter domain-containing protein [Actinokineospora sp. NPDC004072]
MTGSLRAALLLTVAATGWFVAEQLGWQDVTASPVYAWVITALLGTGLYAAAYGIDLREARTHLRTVILAVTVGVLAKVAVIAAILVMFFGDTRMILLAVAVAQIDPLSVAALRHRSNLSPAASSLLSAWASFDDPITVLLTAYLAAFVLGDGGLGMLDTGFSAFLTNLGLNLLLAVVAFILWRSYESRRAARPEPTPPQRRRDSGAEPTPRQRTLLRRDASAEPTSRQWTLFRRGSGAEQAPRQWTLFRRDASAEPTPRQRMLFRHGAPAEQAPRQWTLFRRGARAEPTPRQRTLLRVAAVVIVLAFATIAISFALLLSLAFIGLFVRPGIDTTIDRIAAVALYGATFAIGMVLVIDRPTVLAGIVLGAAAFFAQFLIALLLPARGLSATDRLGLAFAQQNGLTAIVLALLLEPAYPSAAGTIAFAVIVINTLHATATALRAIPIRAALVPRPEP